MPTRGGPGPGSGPELDVRRRDRWPQVLHRTALYSAGFLIALAPAAFADGFAATALAPRRPPTWAAAHYSARGVWLPLGLAAAGVATALGGQLWAGSPARRVVLGLAAAALVWAGLTGGAGPDAGTLAALVAATVAAAVALEGACRPAVGARTVAALAVLPALALLGRWVWRESPAATAWRATFVVAAAIGLWGLWEVAAFRWSRTVRDRRLLIVAVVLLATTGLAGAVRGVDPTAGRGAARLVAVLVARPEGRVYVLADPADQPAAKFLFSAASPAGVSTLDPASPEDAEALNAELSEPDPPLLAVIGGAPEARLNELRPTGAAPPAPAGELRGGDGRLKKVLLLVLSPWDDSPRR